MSYRLRNATDIKKKPKVKLSESAEPLESNGDEVEQEATNKQTNKST